jgi:uncharacterized membrane protein
MPKTRIEAFSDAVFAIVITLLVLEIKTPYILLTQGEATLISAIWNDVPKFTAYALSFLVLTVWWVAHHQFFHSLHSVNRKLLWLNNLFLFWVCLIPFPTALIGTYYYTRTATIVYGIVLTSVATTFSYMRWYAFFKVKLHHEHIPDALLHDAFRKSIKSPTIHAVATLLAFVSPYIAISIYAFLAIYFIFPMKLDKHLWGHGKA